MWVFVDWPVLEAHDIHIGISQMSCCVPVSLSDNYSHKVSMFQLLLTLWWGNVRAKEEQ
jgi:hypothetical protein